MIQAAEKMKKVGVSDWKDMLIINWSDTEKNIVKQYIKKQKKIKLDKVLIQQLNLYVTVFQILLQQWNLKQQRNEKTEFKY